MKTNVEHMTALVALAEAVLQAVKDGKFLHRKPGRKRVPKAAPTRVRRARADIVQTPDVQMPEPAVSVAQSRR